MDVIISKIIDYTIVPVRLQVGYLIHYKSNLQDLRIHVENLGAARERRQHTVDEVKRKGRSVETDVQNWLETVNEITREAHTILRDEGHAKTKCFHGICPNPISYHQLSRKSKKLVERIELHEKKEFHSVSYRAPVEDVCAIRSEEYMDIESRTSMVKNIMAELLTADTNLIGVHGFGGIGKTTLAKEVFRQSKKEKFFDDVVIILNVKEQDLETIHKEIVEKLGMTIDRSESMPVRANRLWDRIKNKLTLVILDDVLGRLDLDALGLLCAPTCKILFTSREKIVWFPGRRMQKFFQLELLKQEETWSLFEKMAGNVVKDENIRNVAIKVAEKCGGLPVLVAPVASALRGSTLVGEWKNALNRFQSFNPKFTETAFSALEWSYSRLNTDELQPLFLLCGIMGHGKYAIFLSDLLKYSVGLGLVKNVHKVEDARNALHSLVNDLKDYGLLLDGYDDSCVRMHDLIRDVALRIASRGRHILSKAHEELNERPRKECSMISLRRCTIPKLPEVPWDCPELKMFYLGTRDGSLEIPGNFFEEMKELRVLDLTGLHFPSLPISLKFLTSLQTLCLDSCKLEDIALVGHLTSLKILSLLHSKVKELPKQIAQLTRLQLLDLSNCSELVQISPNVISSLNGLEDLRINSFTQWEGEGSISGRSNSSVSELMHLSQLTALEIHIPDANVLPPNLFSDKLERYTILIGDCWNIPYRNVISSSMLMLKLTASNQFDQGIKSLLKTCEHLFLDGMVGLNIVPFLLEKDGAKQLKHLRVQNNHEVTYVVNLISWSHIASPKLESLSLENLVNLESVCFGQLIGEPFQKLRSLALKNLPKLISFSSEGSRSNKQLTTNTEAEEIILEKEIGGPTKLFMNGEALMPNLTSLILHKCDGLRFLLSSSMARSLAQLERLVISECQNMEEIVAQNDYKEENIGEICCKLKYLKLQYLPSLAGFCSGSYIEFPSLELLHIEDCPKLGTFIFQAKSDSITFNIENEEGDSKENVVPYFLFDEKVGFPRLERLRIYDLPKLMTIWQNQLAPNSFCRLKIVDVYKCRTLKNIFTPSMIGRLNAFDTLEIRQCESLQVVFDHGGVLNVKETYDIPATQLKTFACPNLNSVNINSCESLKNIFPLSVAKGLQQLEKLSVENCGLEEIISKEEGPQTTPKFFFPKVTHVNFENLPQLRIFYRKMHVSEWPLLKELTMTGCSKVEILASEWSRFQETLELGLLGRPIKQPFFSVEKGNSFPNLEILVLDESTEIWYGPLPAECCRSLNLVAFSGADPKSFAFLEKLRNLEKLAVYSGPWKEIFVYEGNSSGEIHAVGMTLPHVKELYLREMEELLHLGNGNSQPARPIFPNLEFLGVIDCCRLENLISSAISFWNLTTLKVQRCSGLKYLTTYSVAKCLQKLKKLVVKDCERIEEIVASNRDEDSEHEITFGHLQHLKLSNLPSLQGFCSSINCIVKVPSLDNLIIQDCLIELKSSPDGLLLSNSKPERLQIAAVEEEETTAAKEEEKEDDKAGVANLEVSPSSAEANMGEDAVRKSVEETQAENAQGDTSEAQNVAENVNEHIAGAQGNGEPQVSDQKPTYLDQANIADTPSNQASNQETTEVATLGPNEVIALPPNSEIQQVSDHIHDQALPDTQAAANTEGKDSFSELSSSSQPDGNAESNQVAEDKRATRATREMKKKQKVTEEVQSEYEKTAPSFDVEEFHPPDLSEEQSLSVATEESIQVPQPSPRFDPDEVAKMERDIKISEYEEAIRRGRFIADPSLPMQEAEGARIIDVNPLTAPITEKIKGGVVSGSPRRLGEQLPLDLGLSPQLISILTKTSPDQEQEEEKDVRISLDLHGVVSTAVTLNISIPLLTTAPYLISTKVQAQSEVQIPNAETPILGVKNDEPMVSTSQALIQYKDTAAVVEEAIQKDSSVIPQEAEEEKEREKEGERIEGSAQTEVLEEQQQEQESSPESISQQVVTDPKDIPQDVEMVDVGVQIPSSFIQDDPQDVVSATPIQQVSTLSISETTAISKDLGMSMMEAQTSHLQAQDDVVPDRDLIALPQSRHLLTPSKSASSLQTKRVTDALLQAIDPIRTWLKEPEESVSLRNVVTAIKLCQAQRVISRGAVLEMVSTIERHRETLHGFAGRRSDFEDSNMKLHDLTVRRERARTGSALVAELENQSLGINAEIDAIQEHLKHKVSERKAIVAALSKVKEIHANLEQQVEVIAPEEPLLLKKVETMEELEDRIAFQRASLVKFLEDLVSMVDEIKMQEEEEKKRKEQEGQEREELD